MKKTPDDKKRDEVLKRMPLKRSQITKVSNDESWTLRKEYPVPLNVQFRLMFASGAGDQKRLWALASVERFVSKNDFEDRDTVDYQISLFELAWTLFCLGCRANKERTKVYFETRILQKAYCLVRRLKQTHQKSRQ
jgi:hypothetical protein